MANFGSTPVHLIESGIVNVLLLKESGSKHWIRYDIWDPRGDFNVHSPFGIFELSPIENSLHVLNVDANPKSATMLVDLVPIPDRLLVVTI